MMDELKILSIKEILIQAYRQMVCCEKVLRLFWLINFAFCAFFNLVSNGFSNPLSLLICLVYYVFWCIFFRVYYQKKPYFSSSKIFASAVPSSKMIFITLALLFALIALPFLPLMMGFNKQYLSFFEQYMSILQSPETSLMNVAVFSIVFLLISPLALCRPYLAWISALQGYSGSLRKVFKKTRGNYLKFLTLMIVLHIPCFLIFIVDNFLITHGWLSAGFYSIYLIYFNLVFAKVYDFFYEVK